MGQCVHKNKNCRVNDLEACRFKTLILLDVTGKEEGYVTGRVVALVVATKLKAVLLSKTDRRVIFRLEFQRELV